MGLAVFLLLELCAYAALAAAERSWLSQPGLSIWRNALLAASVVIVAGAVGLWLAGSRSRRFGWIILLAVVWLVAIAARVVAVCMVAGSSVPVLLTLFVGQLAFGLMVPAAANEARKAVANEAPEPAAR